MGVSINPKPPYWVDCLEGKHECFSYEDSAIVRVSIGERTIEVRVPDDLANVKILVAVESEGLLFCFGRTEGRFNGEFCGLVMVAKRVSEAQYEVGVWHELYPWALTHFGFDGEKR